MSILANITIFNRKSILRITYVGNRNSFIENKKFTKILFDLLSIFIHKKINL